MKKTLKKIGNILLFIGIVFVVYKFGARDKNKSIQVREVNIENRKVIRTVSTSGEVKAKQEASLSFRTIGELYNLQVKKGDRLTKGNFIASLDTYAATQNSQAVKDARDIIIRDRELFIENYGDNLSAYGGEDEYNIRLHKYEEELSKAEATYHASQASVWDMSLYAPFDGIITDVNKEVGESVMAGEQVVKIANLDELEFEIAIDQEDYGYISVGQRVEIELDAYDNKVFGGVVSELPYYANGSGGTNEFVITITIDKTETPILLGMTGDAHIEVASTETEVPTLMFDEIFYDEENKTYIWVIDNDLIEKEYIETGLEGDVYTEIKTEIDKEVIMGLNDNIELKTGYVPKFPKQK